jgi:GNAT superfamily N-acetyltransferase
MLIMPDISVVEVGTERLFEYASIPIAFRVELVYQVEQTTEGLGLALREEPVAEPYTKDYDSIRDGGERVLGWPERFDITNWQFLLAIDHGTTVGGAVVLSDSPEIHLLNGRRDLGMLWDIRVEPALRGRGVGTALWNHAVGWARGRGCSQFKVETSNVNVPACRFYRKMGCVLGGIDRFAYRGCPETAREVMLLWYLDLVAVNSRQ